MILRLIFALLSMAAIGSTTVRGSSDRPVAGTEPDNPPAQETDLDRFMAQVLARRDENWKKLQQYILEEQERFQLTGPDAGRLYGFERDYTWFIRDGYFIRSPLKVDGVKISESDRTREEAEWLERQKAREKRAAERAKARGENQASPAEEPASTPPVSVEDVLKQTREPEFVSAAYFLRFKFDPGHYALAGRERLNDRDVLKIEYYPSLALQRRPHAAEPQAARQGRRDRREDEQGVAGDAVDRSGRAPDPAIHLRQHRHGLPPGPLARPRGRSEGLDEDVAAVPGVWLPRPSTSTSA